MGSTPPQVPQERMAMTHRDEILPATPEVIAAAIDAARELVERGHCQGQAFTVIDDAACFCAMAALAKVCSTQVIHIERGEDQGFRVDRGIIPGRLIFDSAVAVMRLAMSPRWSGSLSEFNDTSTTDAVVNLFHRAAGLALKAAA